MFAPDLQGNLEEVGNITHNAKTFTIFNTPSDRSCMFHAIAAILHGVVDDTTAVGLKMMLFEFYQSKGKIKEVAMNQ